MMTLFLYIIFVIVSIIYPLMKGNDSMKKIALINDLSGFGRCSLTAAIPVICVMGMQACPLTTAILSAQTEFPSYFCDDFTEKMDRFTDEWKKMHVSFDGIHSGYLASAAQIRNVMYFLEAFHQKDTIYLADPVMGDDGQHLPVFSQKLLDGMRELTAHADVITPNLTELCLLAGADYGTLAGHRLSADRTRYIEAAAHRLLQNARRRQTAVITGIIRQDAGQQYMGTLAVTPDDSFYIETPYTGKHFSGTGDLFASVIIGCLTKGDSIGTAVKKAVAFLQPAIEEASRENAPGDHGVCFEKYLYLLMEDHQER